MAKKQSKSSSRDEEKLFAVLCYLLSIIGVLLVLVTKKDRGNLSIYHAKQGLVFFIAWVIASIIGTIFLWIPVIGQIIGSLLWIGILVLMVIAIVNSINNKMIPLPLIGQYGDKFNF